MIKRGNFHGWKFEHERFTPIDKSLWFTKVIAYNEHNIIYTTCQGVDYSKTPPQTNIGGTLESAIERLKIEILDNKKEQNNG